MRRSYRLTSISTGPSRIAGLRRFTTLERMERTSKPEAEYTGRPSPDGAVKGREGAGPGVGHS